MTFGCEILIAVLAQVGARASAPRFVSVSDGLTNFIIRVDQRRAESSGRIADVRPFPLFDSMNQPRQLCATLEEDIDFDGDDDRVEVARFGRSRLFLNDGSDHFTEAPLLEGREVLCAARFATFADLDGDGRRELFIAAPADPVGEAVLASKPPWLDGLAPRVQRDAATFASGGVVIACSKEGRRDVTESLGLARLAPFRAGAVADFEQDGDAEIVLFGGECDDMTAFWERVVPTFGRVGADPVAAAAAMASLAPPKPPFLAPRVLVRGPNRRFAPVAARFPPELASFDVWSVNAADYDHDDFPDLLLIRDDLKMLQLRNDTVRSTMTDAPERSGPDSFIFYAAVPTPAPGLELTAVNGSRLKLDVGQARPRIVVRLDEVADAAAAAALASEAKALDGADVVLLDANATDDVAARARTALALVSELVAGSRDAAQFFWIDSGGFVAAVAGGITLTNLRRYATISAPVGLVSWTDDARRAAALVALPRAECEAHLPNLALAALTKLESASEKGLDFEFGLALSETRKPAEAAAHFEKVSKDSPDYPRAQLELGRCLARTNRVADARAALERAVDAAPADPVARFELGRLLLSSKEKSEADAGTESLRVATYLKPEFAEAQYAFGQGLARIGRHDEAITALERALALAPEAPQAKSARELLESLRQKKGS